ncbi:hypothetical protein F4861DRAFT_544572 [Xylaria intraflava]|nr:hypothetical protein F4861DRAFT_544572 [Xylaria intraflava]
MKASTAYAKARNYSFNSRLITKAWRTTRIYPRDINKPLSSKYVMLDEVSVARAPRTEVTLCIRPATPDFTTDIANIYVATPNGSQEYRKNLQKLGKVDKSFNQPLHRLAHRKVCKALDLQAWENAQLRTENAILRDKLERKKKNTRKAVKPLPTEKFVKLNEVRAVQRTLRGRVVYADEAADLDVEEN